jgi:cytoskeletal protein CcmA (bactofilin family)
VGQTGHVEGDLHAEEVVVLGEVRGNILCRSKLLLKSNCKVFGNINCRGLVVEEGAWLTGRCEMARHTDDKSTPVDIKSTPRPLATPKVDPRKQVPSQPHNTASISRQTG